MGKKIVEAKKDNTSVNKSQHFHFMGIGGSGISAVAALAKKHGFTVSGCDEQADTPYLEKVKKLGIKVHRGHDSKHLEGVDRLVISPAIIYQNVGSDEYKMADKENKAIVWNKFVGEYLLDNKNVIAISGTHGKGTTTAMLSLTFEAANLDPNVIIGATVPAWKSNYRIGSSDIFIIESDEFYEKFLDYKPSTILVNNIEFDHPDYFKDETKLIRSFVKFIKLIQKDKNLIVNLDSEGVVKMLGKIPHISGLKIYGYTLIPDTSYKNVNIVTGSIISKSTLGTTFSVYSQNPLIDSIYKLTMPGEYNVSNAMGVIIASKIMGVEESVLHSSLSKFSGLGRRFEKVYQREVTIYDDYAHHPTAIKSTLAALRQKYPINRIICIDEPHSYSRTKALLNDYVAVFDNADKVIIGPIFKARDLKNYGINAGMIVKKSKHKDIKYFDSLDKIYKYLASFVKKGDVIIVMGAGESYLWTKKIVEKLSAKKFK